MKQIPMHREGTLSILEDLDNFFFLYINSIHVCIHLYFIFTI